MSCSKFILLYFHSYGAYFKSKITPSGYLYKNKICELSVLHSTWKNKEAVNHTRQTYNPQVVGLQIY